MIDLQYLKNRGGSYINRKFIKESKETPVRLECDVLVAGGGTAGVVAAIAAARNGAKTVLIERNGFLGGTMLGGAGPLHSFFNLWKAFEGVEKIQCVKGIPDEIIKRLMSEGGCFGHLETEIGYNYDSTATVVHWEICKGVFFDMMNEEGVKLLLHTMITDVVKEGDSTQGVIIESKSGREAVLAKVLIDTTGDGDLAFHAGAGWLNTHPDAHAGMPFGMANVDINKAVAFFQENDMLTQLVHAPKEDDTDNVVRLGFDLKKLPAFREYMDKYGLWGPLAVAHHVRDMSFINTTNISPLDALDVEEITRAEVELRKQVMTMSEMLKAHIPGFENSYLNWTPVHFGVRRTRIIECEHDITIDEIVNGVKTEDEIARYGFHDCAPRIMIKNGDCYSIPYRSLLPKKVENLLVAGRMITTDWEAHMSTRNTVSCMAMGQGAGTAAALCVKECVPPRRLDVKKLQKVLKEQGVYLGQA